VPAAHTGARLYLEPIGEYVAPSRDVFVQFQRHKDRPVNGRVDGQTCSATWAAPVTLQ
jgi:hypothetical protein